MDAYPRDPDGKLTDNALCSLDRALQQRRFTRDEIQETLARLKAHERTATIEQPLAFALTTATNVCRDWFRRGNFTYGEPGGDVEERHSVPRIELDCERAQPNDDGTARDTIDEFYDQYWEDSGTKAVEQSCAKAGLLEMMDDLTPLQRRVIELRYLEDWTRPEIAFELRMSVDAVHAHIKRALKRLRAAASKRGFHSSMDIPLSALKKPPRGSAQLR